MLLEAAIHGQGVALTWAALVEEDLRAGRLVRLFDRAMEGPMSYFAVYTPAAARKPKVTAFRDWLVEEGRAFPQGVSLPGQAVPLAPPPCDLFRPCHGARLEIGRGACGARG